MKQCKKSQRGPTVRVTEEKSSLGHSQEANQWVALRRASCLGLKQNSKNPRYIVKALFMLAIIVTDRLVCWPSEFLGQSPVRFYR